MSVILLQSFVSLMLVAAAVLLFIYVHNAHTFDHSDRLALLPLEDAEPSASTPPPANAKEAE